MSGHMFWPQKISIINSYSSQCYKCCFFDAGSYTKQYNVQYQCVTFFISVIFNLASAMQYKYYKSNSIQEHKIKGGCHESTYHHHNRNNRSISPGISICIRWKSRRQWNLCLGISWILRNDRGSTGSTGNSVDDWNG